MVTEYKEKIIEASGEIVTGGGLVAKDEGKLDAFATQPRGPARRRLLNAQAKQRAYARKSKEKVTKRKNRRRRRAARAKKEEAAKKEKEEAEQKKKQAAFGAKRSGAQSFEEPEEEEEEDDEGLGGFPWILF